MFALCAEAAGYSPRSVDKVRGGELVDIELAPAATLEGLVVDAESTPVPDAAITLIASLGAMAVERATKSDAAGRFRLTDVPARCWTVWLAASARWVRAVPERGPRWACARGRAFG